MKKFFLVLSLLFASTLIFAGCGKSTVPATTSTKITFEREVALNEAVNVEFQITQDGKGISGKQIYGKATFKILEFGEREKVSDTEAINGQTFYYLVYDFMGNEDNPADASPKMFVELNAPQIVMLDENTMPTIGGAVGGAYNSNFQEEMGLAGFELVPLNKADWVHTVTSWYTAKVEKPLLAIQYTDLEGTKRYIKINY